MGHFRVLNKVFLMDNNIKCTWVVGNHIRKLQTTRINNKKKIIIITWAPKATKCTHFCDFLVGLLRSTATFLRIFLHHQASKPLQTCCKSFTTLRRCFNKHILSPNFKNCLLWVLTHLNSQARNTLSPV